ncbi:phytanoyl-CoA dioxygenase family protein [Phaeobacter sp. J2-8]|uniref:phytanoyl-CoA dioxygenase family protein n=1 Tax=Phaeobacter sp. J2-8 TaxID=2931394 RepID=UPI001FD20DE2|nr:phytanoyl-CoA dioxygenase family protein [Phaeobacter sp. J2-8]MCJ7872291.1 phytanoyl-CoA dioxygenase family protein [Phaeobacter sp. J2-8]
MLSKEQIHQFVRDGYCILNLKLSDYDVNRAIETVWKFSPPSFERNNPATWTGMVEDWCFKRDMTERGGRLKFRENTRSIGPVRTMTIYNTPLRYCVETLIMPDHNTRAAPIFRPMLRGLYPIFSQPEKSGPLRGHCDTHFFQVSCVIYLSDTDANDGAFVVWPGSHRMIAPVATELTRYHSPKEYLKCRDEVERTIEPVSITGKTGTVVLWHYRLLHAAGRNTGGGVRHAALIDFKNGWADAMPPKERNKAFDENWSPVVLEAERELAAQGADMAVGHVPAESV